MDAGFPRLTADGNLIEDDPEFIAWYTERGYPEVTLGWDAGRYPEVVAREVAALLAVGAGSLLVGSGVLRRTRPG